MKEEVSTMRNTEVNKVQEMNGNGNWSELEMKMTILLVDSGIKQQHSGQNIKY